MKLSWDPAGKRLYETGSKQCVLYPQVNGAYPNGVAWNGFRGVSESPSGAEETNLYANDSKYLGLRSKEDFGGSIKAYTYPKEFAACDGQAELAPGLVAGQQTRMPFGLCYRTVLGNDVQYDKYGYKLHFVYGATIAPSSKEYESVNDSPTAIEFSWDFSTTPVAVTNADPTAYLELTSTELSDEALKALEAVLYGTDGGDGVEGTDPRLPLPDEIAQIIKKNTKTENTETGTNP